MEIQACGKRIAIMKAAQSRAKPVSRFGLPRFMPASPPWVHGLSAHSRAFNRASSQRVVSSQARRVAASPVPTPLVIGVGLAFAKAQRLIVQIVRSLLSLCLLGAGPAVLADAGVAQLCRQGEIDLAVRHQGRSAEPGEFYPATWCVSAEPGQGRVRFHSAAHINADVSERFVQLYPDANSVRIVIADQSPDLAFVGVDSGDEAARFRRILPAFLVEELNAHPQWLVAGAPLGWQRVRYPGIGERVELKIEQGRLLELRTHALLPLRGRSPIHWKWSWPDSGPQPERLRIEIDGALYFDAAVNYRELRGSAAERLWRPTDNQPPREIPGEHWPSRVVPSLVELESGIFQVRNIRTGFHHLVVDTEKGLVVVDAPAGWVELAQIPPTDLVPGFELNGLSERLVRELREWFPQRPIRAVALTHAHDDHVGGAQAFAAEGASLYAPSASAALLQRLFNAKAVPVDRSSRGAARVEIIAVEQRLRLEDSQRPIELIALDGNPHAAAMLGVWLPAQRIFFQSDLHAPNPDAMAPDPARAASECWFAAWAAKQLPADARVLSSHSGAASSRSQLDAWLASPACRDRPANP